MRSSQNYIMTAHAECAGDMLELENIRKVVKIMNKSNPYKKFYVKCQGRGPRTNPSILDGRGFRGYDSFLPLRHATHMDVYIYEKYQW